MHMAAARSAKSEVLKAFLEALRREHGRGHS